MADVKKFALLGFPVSHSYSPAIQKIFAEQAGIKLTYEKIETRLGDLAETVKRLKDENYSGFNCTMPLKSEILKYGDKKTEACELMRSANTVKNENGVLFLHTTDGEGIRRAFLHNGVELKGKRIVIFGASATARSAVFSFAAEKPAKVTVYNRGEENLSLIELLTTDVKRGSEGFSFDAAFKLFDGGFDFGDLESADIFINASSLGMSGFEEHRSFDFIKALNRGCAVFDAVYNPLRTKLLTEAKKSGLKTIDGFWMLVFQGIAAFEIWTGKRVTGETAQKAHELIKNGGKTND